MDDIDSFINKYSTRKRRIDNINKDKLNISNYKELTKNKDISSNNNNILCNNSDVGCNINNADIVPNQNNINYNEFNNNISQKENSIANNKDIVKKIKNPPIVNKKINLHSRTKNTESIFDDDNSDESDIFKSSKPVCKNPNVKQKSNILKKKKYCRRT